MLARTRRLAGTLLGVGAVCLAANVTGLVIFAKGKLPFTTVATLAVFEASTWLVACTAGAAVGWLLPMRTRPTLRHAAAVAAFAAAAAVVRVLLLLALNRTVGATPVPFDQLLARIFPAFFLTACTVAGLGMGLRSVVRERELTAAAARMEAELARARMRTLYGTLRPERMLATLDTISRGIETDAKAADRLLVSLGELLRLSLQRTRTEDVTLAEELRYVAALLEVEAGRAGRPAVPLRQEVPDALLEARMPAGSLSALVEAALEAAGSAGAAPSLAVVAEAGGGRLRLRLADDAPLPVAARAPTLDALARAHEARFAGRHALRYENRPGGGALAHLELPLRLDGEEEGR